MRRKLSKKYGDKLICSKTTTKRLLKNYLGLSYKKEVQINKNKTTPFSIHLREKWIRLFVDLTTDHKCKNVLAIDETSWYRNMNNGWSWSLVGQANARASSAKGKRMTLICSMSIDGIESF